MIERVALAIPALGLAAATLWLARRRSPLAPSVIAVGITAVIAVFFPLASALVTPLSWRHGVHLPDEFVLDAQGQYLAFMAGLCAVVARVRLVRRRGAATRSGAPRDPAATEARDLIVSLGLVVGGALLYGIYVKKIGLGPLLDRSNFAEKYRVSSGLGTFYAGLNLMIAGCLWAEASPLSKRAARAFRAVALGILVWSIVFVAVRTYAVTLLLGYLYLWTRRRGFTLSRVRPSLVLALALAYVGVEAYSLLRSVWQGSMSSAVATLHEQLPKVEQTLGQVIGGSEFSHPFLTMMELDRYEQPGDLGGQSYAQGFLVLAPVWLVADRGQSVSQDFARRHYPELAERGGGTAFCFVGEAWWNVGAFIGPLLAGLALGWLLMAMERSARVDPGGVVSRVLPYSLHLVLLVHRNSFSSLLKQAFVVGFPTVLLLGGAALVWNATRRRRGLAPGPPRPRLVGSARGAEVL